MLFAGVIYVFLVFHSVFVIWRQGISAAHTFIFLVFAFFVVLVTIYNIFRHFLALCECMRVCVSARFKRYASCNGLVVCLIPYYYHYFLFYYFENVWRSRVILCVIVIIILFILIFMCTQYSVFRFSKFPIVHAAHITKTAAHLKKLCDWYVAYGTILGLH